MQTGFGFTGEATDASGLVYLRARYYVPGLGVFPSLDPVEEGNRYGYVGGGVVNRVDPSGMIGERPEQWDGCSYFAQQCTSCVSKSTNSLYGKKVWTCSGTNCQEWLDEAHCILNEGYAGHLPTDLTKMLAEGLVYGNNPGYFGSFRFGNRIDFNGSGGDAATAARVFITMPSRALATLNTSNCPSPEFLSYVSLLVHEYWHSVQAGLVGTIRKEVEAYNIQTLVGLDLGIDWNTVVYLDNHGQGKTFSERWRFDILKYGVTITELGIYSSSDYRDLCSARCILTRLYPDASYSRLLLDFPFVTSNVCNDYPCK